MIPTALTAFHSVIHTPSKRDILIIPAALSQAQHLSCNSYQCELLQTGVGIHYECIMVALVACCFSVDATVTKLAGQDANVPHV